MSCRKILKSLNEVANNYKKRQKESTLSVTTIMNNKDPKRQTTTSRSARIEVAMDEEELLESKKSLENNVSGDKKG